MGEGTRPEDSGPELEFVFAAKKAVSAGALRVRLEQVPPRHPSKLERSRVFALWFGILSGSVAALTGIMAMNQRSEALEHEAAAQELQARAAISGLISTYRNNRASACESLTEAAGSVLHALGQGKSAAELDTGGAVRADAVRTSATSLSVSLTSRHRLYLSARAIGKAESLLGKLDELHTGGGSPLSASDEVKELRKLAEAVISACREDVIRAFGQRVVKDKYGVPQILPNWPGPGEDWMPFEDVQPVYWQGGDKPK